jgi:hypothetical protein
MCVFVCPLLLLAALGVISPAPTLTVLAVEFTPETSAPVVIVLGILLLPIGLVAIAIGLRWLTHKSRMVFDDEKRQILFRHNHIFRRVEKAYDYSDIVGVKLTPDANEDDIDAVGMVLSIAFSNHDEVEIGIREDRDTIKSITERVSGLNGTADHFR